MTDETNEKKDHGPYPPHVTDAQNYAWREREWRRPPVNEGEEVLIEEPGRVLPPMSGEGLGTCCRSHYFLVVKPGKHGSPVLRVRHGGGDQQWRLSWDSERVIKGVQALDSDTRFRFLWMLMDAHNDSERNAEARTSHEYRQAFVDGRLKKRKKRGSNDVRVWIEPKKPN